jgi:ribosomal protein S18 acetylase RimI-like enzyme
MSIQTFEIRAYLPEDEEAVVGVWHRAGKLAYPYLRGWEELTLQKARQVFREVIASNCSIWLATDAGRIVGYLAMQDDYVDRLYIDPAQQRKGWGSRLLEHTRRMHPHGLHLHTHQENHAARAFYERHGFRAVRFGVSPPPENAPDVEYAWRAGGSHEGASY